MDGVAPDAIANATLSGRDTNATLNAEFTSDVRRDLNQNCIADCGCFVPSAFSIAVVEYGE